MRFWSALFRPTVPLLLATLASAFSTSTAGAERHAATYPRFAVATAHPLASAAGAEVLRQGGTAADAAAATMLALGVVSGSSSGLGGGGFALYYEAETGSLTFLDFREVAPRASSADMFAPREGQEGRSRSGGLSTGVPGEAAGIDVLLSRFGRSGRRAVVAPALRLATDGFPIGDTLARHASYYPDSLKEDPTMAQWFDGREQLEAGQPMVQRQLARTLRTFAQQGPRPFYRGAIARAMVAASQAHGGLLTLQDLQRYAPVEREPWVADRFGHRWVTAPLPSAGGYSITQSLAHLERWLVDPATRRSPTAVMHALAESWKGPYWDRAAYFGDPAFVEVPLDALVDPARMRARSAMFRPTLALDFESYGFPVDANTGAPRTPVEDHGTSHLCVVDEAGNVAAITTTVNYYFGARYTAAGMVMNNEMDDFSLPAGEANLFDLSGGSQNAPAPGKRPISSMSPTIVFEDDKPVLCIGGAGGSRIPTATEQVAFRILVQGSQAGAAVAAPRVHSQGRPNKLYTETFAPIPPQVAEALAARGHVLEEKHHLAVVSAIHITEDGLDAASDPRAGGEPAGE